MFLLFMLIIFQLDSDKWLSEEKGPRNEIVDLSMFGTVLYVSQGAGDINGGNGTKEKPFNNIYAAFRFIERVSLKKPIAILISAGEYIINKVLFLSDSISIFGGYDSRSWSRDIEKNLVWFVGVEGDRILIIRGNNVRIDGIIFTGARYRGKGGAIYCNGSSPIISNNIFIENGTLKPLNWTPKYLHQIANDGGAIYGDSGAMPIIRNNLFVRNKTEIGRGGAIAFDGFCQPLILGNVFIENSTGILDTARSSDGGAVSLFRWCRGAIKGNIFLNNVSNRKNDGGALFVALWSSPEIEGNLFINNIADDDGGCIFVGGQEHRYDKPLDPIPPKEKFYIKIRGNILIANKTSKSDAIRITMESRGEFIGNIAAFNTGLSFQRSEWLISHNIILDPLSLGERKSGIGRTLVTDNIICSDLNIAGADVVVRDNKIKGNIYFPGNSPCEIKFKDDAMEFRVYDYEFDKLRYVTTLIVNVEVDNNFVFLKNRVAKGEGNRWGVIKTVKGHIIELWGDLRDVSLIYILPSYKLN